MPGVGYIPELRESLSKPDWRYCRVCSGNAVWFKSEWLRLDLKTNGTKINKNCVSGQVRSSLNYKRVTVWFFRIKKSLKKKKITSDQRWTNEDVETRTEVRRSNFVQSIKTGRVARNKANVEIEQMMSDLGFLSGVCRTGSLRKFGLIRERKVKIRKKIKQ